MGVRERTYDGEGVTPPGRGGGEGAPLRLAGSPHGAEARSQSEWAELRGHGCGGGWMWWLSAIYFDVLDTSLGIPPVAPPANHAPPVQSSFEMPAPTTSVRTYNHHICHMHSRVLPFATQRIGPAHSALGCHLSRPCSPTAELDHRCPFPVDYSYHRNGKLHQTSHYHSS